MEYLITAYDYSDNEVLTRRMNLRSKHVALVCDEQLFVKPTINKNYTSSRSCAPR